MVGAFKSGQDGIARAMGVDDKHFRVDYQYERKAKIPHVMVQILTEGVASIPLHGAVK